MVMMSKKHSRTNPLQVMSKAPKPPASAVETHIDKCNELLGRASLTEGANVAADGKSSVPKMRRRSRGIGQRRPKGKIVADVDSFETKLQDAAITKRRVKSSQEELLVGFKDRDKERRRRRHSEKLVVEFPSESARARRAHRSITKSWTKGSKEPVLKNSIRTADTEVSFDDVINNPNSHDREKKENKDKRHTYGNLDRKFDWSESSIVWGDEECSSDEESSNFQVRNFSSAIDAGEVTSRTSGGGRSIVPSGKSRRSSRDPTCSRSFMDLSFRSTDSCQSNSLWQSFSSMNVSRKKLEP
ncbi:hypothetical protein ACHAWT_002863 [Skeletonema menzelii]